MSKASPIPESESEHEPEPEYKPEPEHKPEHEHAPGHKPAAAPRAPLRGLSARLALAVLVSLPAVVGVGLIVLAVEGKWAPLRRVDEGIAQSLHRHAVAHPLWVHTMAWVSDVGSPTVMRVAVGILAVGLWLRGARRLALWAAVTMVGGAVLDALLKSAVGRARPYFPDPVAHAPGASFPSGHAFTATLGAGVVVLWALPLLPRRWRPAAWACAAAVPLAVGYSRVALGVHWASDVVGGWLLGCGLLAATTAAFETWRRTQGLPRVHPTVEGVAPEETRMATHSSPDEP
jgi:membrane-associated phospholipid phosphatase